MPGSSSGDVDSRDRRHNLSQQAHTSSLNTTTVGSTARMQALSPTAPHDNIISDVSYHVNSAQISGHNLNGKRAQLSGNKDNSRYGHPIASSSHVRKKGDMEKVIPTMPRRAGDSSTTSTRKTPIEVIVISSSPPPSRSPSPSPPPKSSKSTTASNNDPFAFEDDSDIEFISVRNTSTAERRTPNERALSIISLHSSNSSSSVASIDAILPPTPQPRPRRFLSHIVVPPLAAGRRKKDYRPLSDFVAERATTSKPGPSRSADGVTIHQSVRNAFQAALRHNAVATSSDTLRRKGKERERVVDVDECFDNRDVNPFSTTSRWIYGGQDHDALEGGERVIRGAVESAYLGVAPFSEKIGEAQIPVQETIFGGKDGEIADAISAPPGILLDSPREGHTTETAAEGEIPDKEAAIAFHITPSTLPENGEEQNPLIHTPEGDNMDRKNISDNHLHKDPCIVSARTPISLKRKGKERERDVDGEGAQVGLEKAHCGVSASPTKKRKINSRQFEGPGKCVSGIDALMDQHWPPTIIDLLEPHATSDFALIASTRHICAHVLRRQANILRENLSRPPPALLSASAASVYRNLVVPSKLSPLLRNKSNIAAAISASSPPSPQEEPTQGHKEENNTELSVNTSDSPESSSLPPTAGSSLESRDAIEDGQHDMQWVDYNGAMSIDEMGGDSGISLDINDYFNHLTNVSPSTMASPSKGNKETLLFPRDMFSDFSPPTSRNMGAVRRHGNDPLLSGSQGPLAPYAVDPIFGASNYYHYPGGVMADPLLHSTHNEPGSQLDANFNEWYMPDDLGGHLVDTNDDGSPVDLLGGSGTIDPSLLGGGTSTESQPQSPPPSSPNIVIRPSHSLKAVTTASQPQASFSLYGTDDVTTNDVALFSDGEGVPRQNEKISKRKKTDRSKSTASIDNILRRDRRVPKPSLKKRVSQTSLSSTASSDAISERDSSASRRSSFSRSPRASKATLVTESTVLDDSEKTSCHHCRSQTFREKMRCTTIYPDGRLCGKRFCERCILARYPEIQFDAYHPNFICPCCTNTCNCTACSRKRGEEYISMRGTAFPEFRRKHNLPVPKPIAKTLLSRKAPRPRYASLERAAVYGLTGEQEGEASTRDNNNNQVVLSRSTAHPPSLPFKDVESHPKQKKRIFAGLPQPWWGIKVFRDLELRQGLGSTDIAMGKGKGKAVDNSTTRLYVGNAPRPHIPYYKGMSEYLVTTPPPSPGLTASDTHASPTSQLHWPQPDVGEFVSWPPQSETGHQLTVEQLIKAIQAGLSAVTVV